MFKVLNGENVLVKCDLEDEESKTESGLIIKKEKIKEEVITGVIVEIADLTVGLEEDEPLPMFNVGDKVMFNIGYAVIVDKDNKLAIIKASDIYGVLA